MLIGKAYRLLRVNFILRYEEDEHFLSILGHRRPTHTVDSCLYKR